MAVTVKDVAKLAGVSPATVSRVVNKDPRISEKTRNRVLKCLEELDYKVNDIARSLKTSRSHSIAFLCPELPNIFFMTIAKGVEDELKKAGYSLIICNSNESAAEEAERIKLICEKCVDGVIIIPATNQGAHYSQLAAAGIPVVLVDRLVDDFTTDAVLVDNINGSYTAVEHMIGQGFRRIGYIGANIRLTPAMERDEGYRRALADYRIHVDDSIVKYGDFHVRSGYEKMEELMELDEPPEHVFITNYFMHLGAAEYLAGHREKIRNRVTIAAFDDMELASILGFDSILIAQPMMEIGTRAAQILMDRIEGADAGGPQIVRLKTSLVSRDR